MDTSALTILISVVAGLLIGLAGGLWMGKRESTLVGGSHHSAQERVTALEAQLQLITGQYEDVQQRYAEDQKVLTLLEPLRDQLNRVDKTVIEMERKRGEQHTLISEQLRAVVTNDEALRKTTESLESALRGGSTRGRWGEVQLRRIAESAGLQNKLDFVEQKQVDGEGLGKPDMTLHLPGDKYIAIDSKVPFSAYWDAQDIPLTATGEEASRRQRLLDDHVKAVRSHVDSLSKKSYWSSLHNSPEFVICFIPTESLLSAALEADPDVLEWAFNKRVALASPVSVWSVMKTVAFAWQQDALTQDAQTLFETGRELHNRLGTLANHLGTLGRSIQSTVSNYNKFLGTLERRVIPSTRKLSLLGDGEGMPDSFPGIEDSVRELSAGELTEESDD
jgi:DNA recombination protein RmuC